MVRLVEQTAVQAAQPALKSGQATVGTRIDIAHLAATPEGMTLTVTVELTAVDRRRLSFRFEVRDEVEKVGEGTHERFIVDREQRLPRLQAKLDAWRAGRRPPA
jgi:predicted thioesterase